MKSTENTVNITLVEQQQQEQNKFYQLTQTSPLFNYLKPAEYNLYDEDEGVIHVHKMGFDQNRLFYDIRNYTHINTNTVTYTIEPTGTIRFSIHDTLENKVRSILFHEASKKEIVEHILQIQLSTDVVPLPFVESDSFFSRMMNLSSNTHEFTPHYTDVYLDMEANDTCEIIARTMDAYKAGVAHIKHLVDSFPASTWFNMEKIESNVMYKNLYYHEDEDILVLSLYMKDDDNHCTEHNFSLDFYEIREDIQKCYGYEDEELLQKLKPYYRKLSLDGILKAI